MPTTEELNQHFRKNLDDAAAESKRLRKELKEREEAFAREGHTITKPQEVQRLEKLQQQVAAAEAKHKIEAKRWRDRMALVKGESD